MWPKKTLWKIQTKIEMWWRQFYHLAPWSGAYALQPTTQMVGLCVCAFIASGLLLFSTSRAIMPVYLRT